MWIREGWTVRGTEQRGSGRPAPGREAPGGGTLHPARGRWPRLGQGVLVCPGAAVVGDVALADGVSVWYNAVLRGDLAPITVGPGTNIQDGAVVHVDEGFPALIGAGVTVGHRAVLHGCTVGNGALIGMGAVVLTGSTVGEEALVGAGAVVTEGSAVPPRTLAVGVPARVLRPLTPAELDRLRRSAADYRALAAAVLAGSEPPAPSGGPA